MPVASRKLPDNLKLFPEKSKSFTGIQFLQLQKGFNGLVQAKHDIFVHPVPVTVARQPVDAALNRVLYVHKNAPQVGIEPTAFAFIPAFRPFTMRERWSTTELLGRSLYFNESYFRLMTLNDPLECLITTPSKWWPDGPLSISSYFLMSSGVNSTSRSITSTVESSSITFRK